MRILLLNGNTTAAITELCAAAGRAAASPGTEVVPLTPALGPAVISSRLENAIAAHGMLEAMAPYAGPKGETVDGVLLAVSYDTALEAARQLMPCPVLGMTEAACLVAMTTGRRFGLVTFGGVEMYRELIAHHGFSGRLAGLLGVAATPQDALADPGGVAAKVNAAIVTLVAQGAESIILGGAALAGMGARLESPVPLLDGIACGVRLLEGLAGLGLPRPAAGSLVPVSGRVSQGLGAALERALQG
ncbi:aspartate/glutamate racemase family protein [Rhodovarius lipocyclicus]|uniref:aspartate/glutamate racemase family protein n=1 Tax=Rhodovarius lipocyclicus TaxID=268410 RepID=UPI00135CDC47|nr:aspartate/glutamate racemase family protein [Rhodovarius lipocyclicus]